MKYKYFLIFSIPVFLLIQGCSSKKVKSKDFILQANPDEEKIGDIHIIYKNQSGTVTLTLDPYDEDLYLEMSGSPVDSNTLKYKIAYDTIRRVENRKSVKEKEVDKIVESLKKQLLTIPDQSKNSPQKFSDSLLLGPQSKDSLSADVISKVISAMRIAQEEFYLQNYKKANKYINEALKYHKTAEAYALKGSIQFMMNKPLIAKKYWKKALALNPNLPGLENMIQNLERKAKK